jgi:hypothetical protein
MVMVAVCILSTDLPINRSNAAKQPLLILTRLTNRSRRPACLPTAAKAVASKSP